MEDRLLYDMVVFNKLQSDSRREPRNIKRVFRDALEAERRFIVEEHRKPTINEANGCNRSFRQCGEGLADHEHGHELAGDSKVAGKAAKLCFRCRERFMGH